MMPAETWDSLKERVTAAEHPREMAIEVLLACQRQAGYLTDEALEEASRLLGLTTLELEELATFYDFLYRERVGRYVIHVCDGMVCWMFNHQSVVEYLSRRLGITPGGTTPDGLFSLLPIGCLGYCDRSPAMLVNGRLYGPLTPEMIERILQDLRQQLPPPEEDR